jgi:hypothetical protein
MELLLRLRKAMKSIISIIKSAFNWTVPRGYGGIQLKPEIVRDLIFIFYTRWTHKTGTDRCDLCFMATWPRSMKFNKQFRFVFPDTVENSTQTFLHLWMPSQLAFHLLPNMHWNFWSNKDDKSENFSDHKSKTLRQCCAKLHKPSMSGRKREWGRNFVVDLTIKMSDVCMTL